jgi:HSP20 family protein
VPAVAASAPLLRHPTVRTDDSILDNDIVRVYVHGTHRFTRVRTSSEGTKFACEGGSTIMANITRFDPLGEMVSLRQAMDRLFEDSFVSPLAWRGANGKSGGMTPPMDVHETPDEIVVTASLPGISAEDVDITMTGQTLSLRGEFKADDRVERDQYLYRERRFGSFHRTLQLPVRVEGDQAEASFDNGILTLRIPKAEEVKPRQIQIRAGGTSS